jgi:hypothetical protein
MWVQSHGNVERWGLVEAEEAMCVRQGLGDRMAPANLTGRDSAWTKGGPRRRRCHVVHTRYAWVHRRGWMVWHVVHAHGGHEHGEGR